MSIRLVAVFSLFVLATLSMITEARPFADGMTAGTILDSWGGNLGPYAPNSVQSTSYNAYGGFGFFG